MGTTCQAGPWKNCQAGCLQSCLATTLQGCATVLTILTFLSKKTALPYSVDAILLNNMLAVLLGWVSMVLPDRFSIVLSGSITAELHDSTDDPDFFVQKASIDPQYYGSTVC